MNATISVLSHRLSLLSFKSGETNVKVDAIERICACLSLWKLADLTPGTIIILRSFILDWDRTVRASSFRCLRYVLRECVDEEVLLDHSFDKLTVSRLEMSKSSFERSEIVRFIARWISMSKSVALVEFLTKSFLEILLSQSSMSPMTGFTSCVVEILICICIRFPCLGLRVSVVRALLNQVAPFVGGSQRDKILSLAVSQSMIGEITRIPEHIVTPVFMEALLQFPVGSLMLCQSMSAVSISDSDIMMEQLLILRKDPFSKLRVDMFLEPLKDELVHALMSQRKLRFLRLFDFINTSEMDWKFPGWILEHVGASQAISTTSSRMSSVGDEPVGNLTSYYNNEEIERIMVGPVEIRFQGLSRLITDHLLNDETQINPLIFAIAMKNLTSLAFSEPSSVQAGLVSSIASLHSLNSEFLWLALFKREPIALSQAIETGWMQRMWEESWVGCDFKALDIFPSIIDISFSSFPTMEASSDTWLVNGAVFQSVTLARPPLKVLLELGALNSQYRLELIWNSPLSVPHDVAFIDSSTVRGSLKVQFGSHDAYSINVSDKKFHQILKRNTYTIGGTKIAEFQHTDSAITLTFESLNDGNEFNLICLSRNRLTNMSSLRKRTFEWLQYSPLCVLGSSECGIQWINNTKQEEIHRAIFNLKSSNFPDAKRGLYLLGMILIGGSKQAIDLCCNIGFVAFLNDTLTRQVPIAREIFTACYDIAEFASFAIKDTPILLPPLAVLKPTARKPAIPDVWLPNLNQSAAAEEAFTELHLTVLREIDSLASSVHFKQKSSSLSARKQKSPEIFLSIPLWLAAMERLQAGRFNLQSRRAIHSLFMQTFHSPESMQTLDRLVSHKFS